MKTGKSLSELAHELERRAGAKQDVVADTRSLHMSADGSALKIGDEADSPLHAINEIAHDQLGTQLEIPAKYYNRMRKTNPVLLSENVNSWFVKNPKPKLIRMLDGQVRAVLSNRYQRIENEQIANIVLPILMAEESVRVVSCEITDSRMYIKAVFPKIQGEVRTGDMVQAGISISNSEVGMGSVRVEPLIFRLVCDNGMIINDAKFTAVHVGAKIGSDDLLIKYLSDEAIKADDTAVLLKTRDVVRASFNEVRFQQHLRLMVEATDDKLQGNPAEAVKVLVKREGLTEFESGSILRHLIEGADTSRWGLLNAVTRTAQDVSSYDRATELETLGGNILHLPRNEWETLAQAA